MASEVLRVSVGGLPPEDIAAANRLLHAFGVTRVTQAESRSASVAKFAMVGVWLLLSGSWMASPHPPVERSTKLGTLPAAMRRPSAGPLSVEPTRNCAFVQTDATVVISLMTTLAGGLLPMTANNAIAGLLPPLRALGSPPVARRYRLLSAGTLLLRSSKRPSLSVFV